jgi:hypothetical protein
MTGNLDRRLPIEGTGIILLAVGNRTGGSMEGNVMARKIVLFLMVGIFVGALAGLAMADFSGEAPQSAAAEEQISAEPGFTESGGVADYWPEDNLNNTAQERGPVETGALPEMLEDGGNEAPSMETSGTLYRVGIEAP